jgi:hypothetical protein
MLLLPFAWIGAVGGSVFYALLFSGRVFGSELPVRLALLSVTPLVAGALGWLLGSLRVGLPWRVVIFLCATPIAGAINGVLLGLVGAMIHGDTGAYALGGAALGAGCGLCFLPALAPAFAAHLLVWRARFGSFVHRADRRAIGVVTAGVGAIHARAFSAQLGRGFVPNAMIVAGVVVGLVGLLEDGFDYARVLAAANSPGLVPAGPALLDASTSRVVDLGMGDDVADVVASPYVAYRDAPRRTAVVLGDSARAQGIVKFALWRDALVVAVSLVAALWR